MIERSSCGCLPVVGERKKVSLETREVLGTAYGTRYRYLVGLIRSNRDFGVQYVQAKYASTT
jgi:hypothetical protein